MAMTSGISAPRLIAVWRRRQVSPQADGQSRSTASSPPSGQLAAPPKSTRDRATAPALSIGAARARSAGAGATARWARRHQSACQVPSSQCRLARVDASLVARAARRSACLHALHACAQSSPQLNGSERWAGSAATHASKSDPWPVPSAKISPANQ
jgi:hypothetical protein